MAQKHSEKQGSAIDLLETEDGELQRLFSALRATRGPSVEERAEYGNLAKDIIQHLATRESALVDVSDVASGEPSLHEISSRLQASIREHRPYIDRVEKMSRGVQGINLRIGQDFDGELEDLMQVVGAEIEWELSAALRDLKAALEAADREDELKSAEYLSAHAPTNLHPDGPRWWERAPLVSRLVTVYDRLRDFPKAKARHHEAHGDPSTVEGSGRPRS
jgi:hypothetical protein